MPLRADKRDGKVCNDAGVLGAQRVPGDWPPRPLDQTRIPSLRRYRIVAISGAPPLGLSPATRSCASATVQQLSQLLAAPSAALRNHLATSHPAPLLGRLPRSAMQSPIPYQLRRQVCTC
jgi:hypothetical protein